MTLEDGREIVLTVVDIRDNHKVRLGVTADDSIRIDRYEVAQIIKREKEQAATEQAKDWRQL